MKASFQNSVIETIEADGAAGQYMHIRLSDDSKTEGIRKALQNVTGVTNVIGSRREGGINITFNRPAKYFVDRVLRQLGASGYIPADQIDRGIQTLSTPAFRRDVI